MPPLPSRRSFAACLLERHRTVRKAVIGAAAQPSRGLADVNECIESIEIIGRYRPLTYMAPGKDYVEFR